VFLDVSQAFDRVCQPGLLYKIIKHLPPFFPLLESYLSNRQFRTRVKGEVFPLLPINSGWNCEFKSKHDDDFDCIIMKVCVAKHHEEGIAKESRNVLNGYGLLRNYESLCLYGCMYLRAYVFG